MGNTINWRTVTVEQILKPLGQRYLKPIEDVGKNRGIIEVIQPTRVEDVFPKLPEPDGLFWRLAANRVIMEKMYHVYQSGSEHDAVDNMVYKEQMLELRGQAEKLIRRLEKYDTRKACRARLWATDPVPHIPPPVKIGDKAYEVCPHRVGSRDTPASVAKKYKISEELLKAANKTGIRGDKISSSVLVIPLPPEPQVAESK